jgi:hypothetical protein
MVGGYISTSVVGGKSVALFPVGKAPTNGQAFNESLYTVSGGPALLAGSNPSSTGPVLYTVPSHVTLNPPILRN